MNLLDLILKWYRDNPVTSITATVAVIGYITNLCFNLRATFGNKAYKDLDDTLKLIKKMDSVESISKNSELEELLACQKVAYHNKQDAAKIFIMRLSEFSISIRWTKHLKRSEGWKRFTKWYNLIPPILAVLSLITIILASILQRSWLYFFVNLGIWVVTTYMLMETLEVLARFLGPLFWTRRSRKKYTAMMDETVYKITSEQVSQQVYDYIGIPVKNEVSIFERIIDQPTGQKKFDFDNWPSDPIYYKFLVRRPMTLLETRWISSLNKLGPFWNKTSLYIPYVVATGNLTNTGYYLTMDKSNLDYLVKLRNLKKLELLSEGESIGKSLQRQKMQLEKEEKELELWNQLIENTEKFLHLLHSDPLRLEEAFKGSDLTIEDAAKIVKKSKQLVGKQKKENQSNKQQIIDLEERNKRNRQDLLN